MLRYVIVGSGYRSLYYGRIASRYSELFQALFLCRSAEKAALVQSRTAVQAVTRTEEALAFKPDFAVIAVDKGHVFEVARQWVEYGIPVLTETPAGDTMAELDALWRLYEGGARISCCEQYFRYPILIAGLKAVEDGLIGTPQSAYCSMLHDYHAASILRKALRIRPGEGFAITGLRSRETLTQSDSREGAIWDGSTRIYDHDQAIVSFASGKTAIYDFNAVQYRTFLRSRHLSVRGDRGEWSDTLLLCEGSDNQPERRMLTPEIPAAYRCLDTQALRDRRRFWSAEISPDTVQDEFAIASILWDMGAYLSGGPSPYDIREALEDAYFYLLLKKACTGGKTVRSDERLWHDQV